ncbi:hypothetical protein SAMN05216371_0174 [Streptomyces sp. TLI_053]|uniref:hypothetical protein n=1 Tax=Streptomyces sp. TLI_053 TaxID=1855352 RepID=UPI00087BFF37|nr:hypothetical protein [Streptomyces sp. TLI_053]SDS56641.1 hypothetical protein SAMN05216371_0174 [Streptomyces sp. TLI_053]
MPEPVFTNEHGDCPTLYETETGDIVVQGDELTDPDGIAQLLHLKTGETAVVIPRALLTRFAPKD